MPTSSSAAAWSGAGRVSGSADVERALQVVRDRAHGRSSTEELQQPVGRAAALSELKPALPLPVVDQLAHLLPDGLRRGAVIGVRGPTSLWVGMLAAASARGSWCAVVGVPELGLLAVAETGVDLARLALVPEPGVKVLDVLGALIGGFDAIVFRPAGAVDERNAAALAARARKAGTVLIPVGGGWPGADLVLDGQYVDRPWPHDIPERGWWTAEVAVQGRGGAGRPRRETVYLPVAHGPAVAQHRAARDRTPLRAVS